MSIARRLTTTALTALVSLAAAAAIPLSASAAGTGALTVTNLDVLPGNSTVVMNKIQNPADSSQRMHDKVSLQLKNTGTAGLTVSSLATTDAFTLTSPYKLPFTLSSGSSVNLTVSFTATGGAWHTGTGTINWTNGTAQVTSLGLTGWWQNYSEHGLEPHLNDLVKNFGYSTEMPTAIYSRGAYQAFSEDEVLSPYWKLLDSAQPARITEIAAWRGYPSNVVVSKFSKGGTTNYQVFSGLKNDAQSAYPRNTSWARGTTTFSIGGPIGLKVDNEYSDPKLNDSAVDRAAGCTATQCGQHLRVFKVRTTAGGQPVPGAYLLAEDFGGINYDYNDNVFLLENITPA